jgi:hypothetical protein
MNMKTFVLLGFAIVLLVILVGTPVLTSVITPAASTTTYFWGSIFDQACKSYNWDVDTNLPPGSCDSYEFGWYFMYR